MEERGTCARLASGFFYGLVGRTGKRLAPPTVTAKAEFFVMRRYRRRRIGERAAHMLFARFPGPWEVREKPENATAVAFWRTVIGRFGDAHFEEILCDNEHWRGPVQRFASHASG